MSEKVKVRFSCRLDSAEDVHDGDTLESCLLVLPGVHADAGVSGALFPEIYAEDGKVHLVVAVRLRGVDAPEIHPRRRLPNGTLRALTEVAHERHLAVQARQAVVDLLVANDLRFEVVNPELGKFSSRIVASVVVTDKTSGERIDVSERLLACGLAKPYAGGTKQRWLTTDGPPDTQ